MRVSPRNSRGSGLSREDALRCIPVKHALVIETILDNGDVLLHYVEPANPWISRVAGWLGKSEKRIRRRKLQLDALGSQVWHLIDGKNPVEEIIRSFARKHQLHQREAETAVVQFLRSLGQREIIFLK